MACRNHSNLDRMANLGRDCADCAAERAYAAMSPRRVTVRGVVRFFAPYAVIVIVGIPLGLITAAVYPIR